QQRAAGHTRGAAGAECRYHTEQQGGGQVHADTQGMHGGQGQYADGHGRASHVDGGTQRNGDGVGVLVQAQTLAQLHVDRHVGRRAAGEEGGQAAFAQAHEHQRVGIAANLPPDDDRVDDQGHEQHAADQHQQQLGVTEQGVQAGVHQGGGHQREYPERREVNHHLDDQGDASGQVREGFPGRLAALPDRPANSNGPVQDADVIGFQQSADRVAGDVEEQGLERLADAAGRVGAGRGLGQRQGGGPQAAGDHRDDGGAQGAHQVEHQHRANVGRLSLLMASDGGDDQQKDQHGGHCLECGNEQIAEQGDVRDGLRQKQGKQNAGHQPDEDLDDQAGTGEQLQEGTLNHVGIL